ncbi:MAG: hypothetical protein K2X87_13365 [Gemmataceae bacterium]|nr:hypothetical protein [Gemmataceae bacterium]
MQTALWIFAALGGLFVLMLGVTVARIILGLDWNVAIVCESEEDAAVKMRGLIAGANPNLSADRVDEITHRFRDWLADEIDNWPTPDPTITVRASYGQDRNALVTVPNRHVAA